MDHRHCSKLGYVGDWEREGGVGSYPFLQYTDEGRGDGGRGNSRSQRGWDE